MASDAEIERIRKDKGQWLPLAQRLFRHVDDETLAERHVCLLESLVDRKWQLELSYRQAEWLLDIRDEVEVISQYRGYSLKFLIQRCFEARFGLDDEEDLAWITALFGSGRTSIRRYEARRVFVLAQCLDEVEED